MLNLLEGLNDKQKQAVVHGSGPLLIVAGAGSGKTRTLTHRIAYLIQEKNIRPDQILAVTFTNKAADEMKKRITELTGLDFNTFGYHEGFSSFTPVMGTFHSICARILRLEIENIGRKKNFVIFDAYDQKSLMRQIVKDLNYDEKRFQAKAVLAQISSAKNEFIDETVYAEHAENYFQKNVAQLYSEYQKRLIQNNAVDFDDLLVLTIKILQQYPNILSFYQDKWPYISVDEYQDTNHIQYLLVRLLSQKYSNLCVIGDSDQSIYSFRGADIRNILEFEKHYPDAKIIKLEQNYRSTQIILDASDSVIEKNLNRPNKKMWTDRDDGEKLVVRQCYDERDEGQYIAQQLQNFSQKNDSNFDYSQCVILYRTNAQSRILEESMMKNAIPYKVVGGVKFYARREIKDILGYLRVLYNFSDTVSLLRIINVPSRKIGAKSLSIITQKSNELHLTLWEVLQNVDQIDTLGRKAKSSIKSFVKLMNDFRKLTFEIPIAELIRLLLEKTGYKDYLLADGTEEGKVRLENVLELISLAHKYSGLDPRISLTQFLEEVALVADIDSFNQNDQAVTLMTLHSVKGLEFPYVFIAGCEENIFPHARSLVDEIQLEEERRLMYVGMTRGQHKLYLLSAHKRVIFGEFQRNPMSRFVFDIPPELIQSNIMVNSSIQKSRVLTGVFDDFDFDQD